MNADTPYWIAFSRIPQIGRARIDRLERAFGRLAEAWRAPAGELRAAGIDDRSVRAIEGARRTITPERELAAVERAGAIAITRHDDEYPRLLKESFDRPPVLYVRGILEPDDDLALAVVGTRSMTSYGRQVTEQLTRELCGAGLTIVSGLARGVDATAHSAALRAGGRTVAVLPCGIDKVYPAGNAGLAERIVDQGVLVSELPPNTPLGKDSFPRRNRIIVGLALGVIVTEAPVRSGALLTARLAADDNREVFAVPGGIFSPMSAGANGLIQDGAKLIRSVDDILTELNLAAVVQQAELAVAAPGGEAESLLLGLLTTEPTHIDELTRQSGLRPADASSGLALLELKGYARQVGGMHYTRMRESSAVYVGAAPVNLAPGGGRETHATSVLTDDAP